MFLKAVIRDNPCTTGRRRRTASGSRGDLRGLAAVAVLAFLIAASLLPPLTGHASAAPSIEILSPTPNTVISGTVDVRVRYVDPTGIRQIWVSAGGQSVFDHQFAQYPTTYTVEMKWDTTKNEDGEALILCDGWNATNQYTHLTGKYTVNNAKGPSISWRSPRAGDIYTDSGPSTAKVDATVAKGQGSAVKKVSLFLDGKTLSSRTFTPAVDSTVLSHTLDVGALSNGSYELRIRAENTTGGMTEAGRTIYRTDDVYTYYLAEGSTDWGFSTYISIVNPNSTAVSIRITYQTKDGPVRRQVFTMAPESQATINTADDLGATDFSTRVDCVEGLAIAADRTMTWNAGGGEEGHCSIGVTSPAPTWYLPEGSSAWGFECWLLVQNPNDTPADCTVTYM
ncbi:MAG: hypothetical protein FJ313_07510, partial [Gemmatimonadetes bacterium]|nr:hypothetical protein [Gemmatimonadota bacterium]